MNPWTHPSLSKWTRQAGPLLLVVWRVPMAEECWPWSVGVSRDDLHIVCPIARNVDLCDETSSAEMSKAAADACALRLADEIRGAVAPLTPLTVADALRDPRVRSGAKWIVIDGGSTQFRVDGRTILMRSMFDCRWITWHAHALALYELDAVCTLVTP